MAESELAASIVRMQGALTPPQFAAVVETIFDAFRARGESSEDAVEGAGTTLERIEQRDSAAFGSLVNYAAQNAGLLKDAIAELPAEIAAALTGAQPAR